MSDGFRIYFVRHAIAEERGEAYPDDRLRPLSRKGIAKFRKAAEGLDRLGVTIDRILCSPLVRARETADILSERLGGHPEVVEIGSLAPGGSFEELMADLEAWSRFGAIALVGHEPSIGDLAARLVGLRSPLEFKKGAVCRVDVETLPPAGPGRLRWFVTPRMLSLLG
jgi:phosphohistidine phosphatase